MAKQKRRKSLSPEDNPLWGLFGVWGRVLIVFTHIGFLLHLGAVATGWGMLKFLIHVYGLGLLLLFARPNYSPFLSTKYCETGMQSEELADLRAMIVRKLYGEASEYTPPRTPLQPPPRDASIFGSLGTFGRFLDRVVKSDS